MRTAAVSAAVVQQTWGVKEDKKEKASLASTSLSIGMSADQRWPRVERMFVLLKEVVHAPKEAVSRSARLRAEGKNSVGGDS